MNTIIFFSFIAAVIALGLFFHGRERRKQKAERERKLKLAEGGQVPDPPKRKKRRWWPKKKSDKLPMPEETLADYKVKVPPYLSKVLAAYHAQNDANAACEAARKELVASVDEERANANVPARPERLRSFSIWLNNAVDAIKNTTAASRKHNGLHEEYRQRISELRGLKAPLGDFIQNVYHWDQTEMDTELARIIDITKSIMAECADNELPRGLAPKLAESATADEQLQQLIDETVNAMEALFKGLGELSIARSQCAQSFAQLTVAKRAPELSEPEKPNDQDVQALLTTTLQWSQAVQEQAAQCRAMLPALQQTQEQCSALVGDLSARVQAFGTAKEERQKQQEAKRRSPRGWGKDFLESPQPALSAVEPELATGAIEVTDSDSDQSQPQGQTEKKKKALRPMIRPWWEEDKDSFAADRAKVLPECELLTDEQAATADLAMRVYSHTQSLFSELNSQIGSWTQEASPVCTGELSQEEANTVKGLRAAMRTLAFAIAQSNVASAKLEAAMQEPERQVDATSPALDEANVENFVRSHRKWVEDRERTQRLNGERKERLQALQQQFSERKKQVPEAAISLESLVKASAATNAKRPTMPAELESTILAARHLASLYVPPPPTPAPAPARKKEEPRRHSGGFGFLWD